MNALCRRLTICVIPCHSSAPVQDEMLGLNKSTGKKDSKGKGKATSKPRNAPEGSASAVFGDIPMRALPLDSSPAPAAVERGRSDSPAVARPGFAPVRGFAAAEDGGGGGGGAAAGEKLAIPMQVKRKAVGEAAGAPASKK